MKKLFLLLTLMLFTTIVNASDLEEIEYNDHQIVLLGEKLSNGFCRDLSLRIETDNTPYMLNPNVAGGYYPKLDVVELRKGEKQLLLSIRQGGQNAISEYRIFAKRNSKIFPIFEGIESSGVIRKVNLDKRKMEVCLSNGTKQCIDIDAKIWEKVENEYERGYEPEFSGIYSLTAVDGDGDGVQELYVTQRIALANQELGYVAVRMDLQKDNSWKMSHYVLQMPTLNSGNDVVNVGVKTVGYEIYPTKIFIEQAQGAIPNFYCNDRKIIRKINDCFSDMCKQDLYALFDSHASMGFEVVLSYDSILSMRFIGSERKYNKFLHIDPITGDLLNIEDMFVVNKKFLKTMTILSPSKHKYVKDDLKNWFIKGTQLHVVLDGDSVQHAEKFSLSAFESFLSPKNKILKKNSD